MQIIQGHESQLHLHIIFDNQIIQSWGLTRPPESIVSQPTVNWHILKLVHHGAAMIYHEWFLLETFFHWSRIEILWHLGPYGRVENKGDEEEKTENTKYCERPKEKAVDYFELDTWRLFLCRSLWIRYSSSATKQTTIIIIAFNISQLLDIIEKGTWCSIWCLPVWRVYKCNL